MATLPWGLQVTQDGKPLQDQRLGLRLFKDMSYPEERYRIVLRNGLWVAYHCGRRIIDTPAMRYGASNPGILIDQIRHIRGR
jgi:hypothetical protein